MLQCNCFFQVLIFKNAPGNTALIYAAMVGNPHILKALVNAGAKIEAHTIMHNTPLMIVAAKGHSDAVVLLIQCSAIFMQLMIIIKLL